MNFAIALVLFAQAGAADVARQADIDSRTVRIAGQVADTYASEARQRTPQQLRQDSEASRQKWRDCIKKFAENASIVSADSSFEVVEIAILNCKTERKNAEIFWAKEIFRVSQYHPDMLTAMKWASRDFDESENSTRNDMVVQISLFRQIAALKDESRQIRRDLNNRN